MQTRAHIEIEHVMDGADILTCGEERLALGFPEEVVKAWQRARVQPTAWLIPDVRAAAGIVQWSLEFPLYFALFVQGLFAKNRKIRVLVQRCDWPDVVEYLRLSLLGLTRKEMLAEQVRHELAEMLAREADYLALKRPDGAVAAIEDFLEPLFFDREGVVELEGLRVKAHGANTYSFFTDGDRLEEYRLESRGGCPPPYTLPLAPASSPCVPQPFEVIALGTGSGFDPGGPCTGLLVQANGRSLLVDSGPYVKTLLEHCGVSLGQVSALVLTHAHEDHCVGLQALLGVTRRVRLYVTRETAAIMRRKLAILNPRVASPARLLDDAFDVVPVEPGQVHDFYGLEMRFHYTMHSIPCTGVELAMEAAGSTRRALIVGDHNSRRHIEEAPATVLPPERRASLDRLYAWSGDLLVHDAGEGLIHGGTSDFADSPARTLAAVHTTALAPEQRHLVSLARPGHRYTIVPESSRPTAIERGLAQRALGEAFPASDPEWLAALLDAAEAISVNRDQIVVRQQQRNDDLFVALTGELAILASRGGPAVELASVQAGEVFGEMAAVNDAPRSASVRARTPARLLRIPGAVFRTFAERARLRDSMRDLWGNRDALQNVSLLATATVTARNALARSAVRRGIEAGSTLIREGSSSSAVFVLVKGRVQVFKGAEPLLAGGAPVIIEPGNLIGESAPLLDQARNASIVALDHCEVLAIRGPDFRRIIQSSPQLFCAVSRVVRERCAA